MFICEKCKKEFDTKKKLGCHSNFHKETPEKIAYELNPKICLECDQPISYRPTYVHNKNVEFCSVSCRAKYFYHKKGHLNPKNSHRSDK